MNLDFPKLPFGATPIDDLSGLIPTYITTRQELYNAEFKNIAEATYLYLTRKKVCTFSLKFLYKVHHDMFKYVWKWAGKKRITNLNIGVDKNQIDIALKNLLDDLKFWETSNVSLLERSVILHHRLVKIHPFLNGNGRWARLVINIYLKQHAAPLIKWPENSLTNANNFREQYIQALKEADAGNYLPLTQLHQDLLR